LNRIHIKDDDDFKTEIYLWTIVAHRHCETVDML